VAKPGEPEEGFNHVHEPFSRSDFDAHTNIAASSISPVVPDAGLDNGRFALPQNAGLPVALYGEFTFQWREAFGQNWVVMFAHDTRTGQRNQLADSAALQVLPWQFEKFGVFSCNGVLPYLSDLDWSAIGPRIWVGVRHVTGSRQGNC